MKPHFTVERLEKLHKVLLLLVPLVYAAVMSFSFTSEIFPLDDGPELVFVRGMDSKWNVFGPDVFGLFRPVKNILFLLFANIFGFGFKWCRLVGLVIGILSFFPVLALARRVLANEWKAILAASIWLLSPTLVSSVAWLSCLNIQIMATFATLSIVCHDSAWDIATFRSGRIALAGLLFFLALVSYESAVSVLPIVFLFDFILRPGRCTSGKAFKAYSWYVFIFAVYLLLRHANHSSTGLDGNFDNIVRWQIMVSSPFFVAEHFISWFWPFGRMAVVANYKWGMVSAWHIVLDACILAIAGIHALLFRRNSPVVCFCILFSLFAIAPVSNCLGFGNGPYGDYYLTLVSIGLSMGSVELCSLLLEKPGRFRLVTLLLVVLFVASRIAAVPIAAHWSFLWGRGVEAHKASIQSFPSSFSNKIMLAHLLFDRNQREEAMAWCDSAESDVSPDSKWMATIHLLRAMYALMVSHDADLALGLLEKSDHTSEAQSKGVNNRHYYRGCVFEDLKNDEKTAEREYELALVGKWNIDSVPCADRLARLKAIHGERDEAIALWERAAKLDPSNASVLWNLSFAYREAGDITRSERFRNAALSLLERQ